MMFDFLMGNKCIELGILEPLIDNGLKSLSFLTIDIHASFEGDHSPSFMFIWILFGIKMIEFNWYDVRHQEAEDE